MTQFEIESNELARDLASSEPEILKEDLPFQPDTFSSGDMMYEGLALGDSNPFFGD